MIFISPSIAIDEREISSVEKIHLKEIRDLIEEGLILDGKTLLALAMVNGLKE